MINFVSNLPKDLWTGGFSAMNAAAFSAISSFESTHYAGPINPRAIPWEKAISKCRRVAGLPGTFFFFSKRRLVSIAEQSELKCHSGADLDFYHGFTPWIMTRPKRPYVAWSDCTFRDYANIYCRLEHFHPRDLQRIEQTEAAWLRNAARVLFTSEWAAQRAQSQYGLKPSQVASVGIFGSIDMPTRDLYDGGQGFMFVSTNFEAKGGWVLLSAFREVKRRYSGATLTVVGDRPRGIRVEPGVTFTGYLRKESQHERGHFEQILGRARALVHPTQSDIAPLLIVEAGYFGCPTISTRRFAIPELVEDRRTGLLLEEASQVDGLIHAMCWMLEDNNGYLEMRRAAWAKARGRHSRSGFDLRLRTFVEDVLKTERLVNLQ